MKEKIDPIELKEIENSIKTLKNGKTTGPDEIPNEIFTKAEPQTVEIYKEILHTIANNKEIPEQWQKGQIIRLYKGKRKKRHVLKRKRHNPSKQLWETVRKNIEQQGQKQNKHDR